MATGFIPDTANAILDLIFRGTAWSAPTGAYLQLHTGDPGAAGTANVATETDRVAGTFGTPASSATISNTATLTWTGVAGSEDYTHFSVWGSATSGTCYVTGTITANAVTANDTFSIGIGNLSFSIPVAS